MNNTRSRKYNLKTIVTRHGHRSLYYTLLLAQLLLLRYVLNNSLSLTRYQYATFIFVLVVCALPILSNIVKYLRQSLFRYQQHEHFTTVDVNTTSKKLNVDINYSLPFLPITYWYQSAKQHFASLDGRLCLSVVAALIVFGLFLLLIPHSVTRLSTFLPEQVSLYAIVDSYPQRVAYQCYLLTLFAAVFAIQISQRLRCNISMTAKYSPIIMSVILLIAIIWSMWTFPLGDRARYLLLSTCLVALMAYHKNLRWVAWVYMALAIAFATVPGWLHVPAPIADGLKGCDQHYDMVMYRGRHLASGHLFSQENPPYYSLLWSTLIGIFSKAWRAPTFAELVRVNQLGQILFLLAYALAAWQRTSSLTRAGRAITLTFITIAVIPWLTTDSLAIWRPNQAGLRYLFIPIAISIIFFIQRLSLRQASVIVGIVTGLALLANFETGIVVMAGLGMSWLLIMREQSLQHKLDGAMLGIAAMSMMFLIWTLTYFTFFAAWPFPDGISNIFSFLSLFAGGFGGLALPLRILVICMMCHAGYIFMRALIGIVDTKVEIPDLVSCSIVVMILVWFPYYINRPDDWNLWTFIALYSLLLVPTFSGSRTDVVPFMVFLFIVLPISARSFPYFVIDQYDASGLSSGIKVGCAGGLVLPTDYCAHLENRAQTLKDFATRGTIVWSTSLPVLTDQMTSLTGPFWTSNLLSLSLTIQGYNAVVKKIKHGHFDYVIFDDPHDPFIQPRPPENAFHQRLVADLQADYCAPRLIGGWFIAQRKQDGICKEIS